MHAAIVHTGVSEKDSEAAKKGFRGKRKGSNQTPARTSPREVKYLLQHLWQNGPLSARDHQVTSCLISQSLPFART